MDEQGVKEKNRRKQAGVEEMEGDRERERKRAVQKKRKRGKEHDNELEERMGKDEFRES